MGQNCPSEVEALSERTHLYYQATTRALPQQLEDLGAPRHCRGPQDEAPQADHL